MNNGQRHPAKAVAMEALLSGMARSVDWLAGMSAAPGRTAPTMIRFGQRAPLTASTTTEHRKIRPRILKYWKFSLCPLHTDWRKDHGITHAAFGNSGHRGPAEP